MNYWDWLAVAFILGFGCGIIFIEVLRGKQQAEMRGEK